MIHKLVSSYGQKNKIKKYTAIFEHEVGIWTTHTQLNIFKNFHMFLFNKLY